MDKMVLKTLYCSLFAVDRCKLPVASDIPPLPDAVKSSLPLRLSGRDGNYFVEADYQHTLNRGTSENLADS